MTTLAFKAGLTFKAGQGENEITVLTNVDNGANYAANEIITLTGGTGTGAKAKVLTVDGGGNILTYEINDAGEGYTAADALTQASTTGSGTGATFTATTVAEIFNTLEEVKSLSGFGKTNELVDVTNFSSPNNTKEYISGLADGAEITVECNKRNTTGPIQTQLIDDVDDGESARNIRITWTDGTTAKQYDFAVVCLSYTYGPSLADANKITFTLKITGDIAIT
jgi:hypothetical protein